ncbi:MAG: SGNH/GDSL hydrolase family protein [Gemmataceae bacterium]
MLAASLLLCLAQPSPYPLEIKDGDRIVWIGSTVVEREQRYGYWELALHAAYPDKSFTLRNLGWSGDTVYGDARAGFENAAKGFKDLVKLTLDLKPTIIFVSYGTNESFEGEAGLPKFKKGMLTLLDSLKPTNAKIVLFSPTPFEARPGYLTEQQRNERNANLQKYSDAIRGIADDRKLAFADAFHHFQNIRHPGPFTDNGMHYTAKGYDLYASFFTNSLVTPGMHEKFRGESAEKLRQAIVAKNELFFHRWRPQNETYLFGFRKHEQGNNAVEVVKFEPLVAEADKEIEKLRSALLK